MQPIHHNQIHILYWSKLIFYWHSVATRFVGRAQKNEHKTCAAMHKCKSFECGSQNAHIRKSSLFVATRFGWTLNYFQKYINKTYPQVNFGPWGSPITYHSNSWQGSLLFWKMVVGGVYKVVTSFNKVIYRATVTVSSFDNLNFSKGRQTLDTLTELISIRRLRKLRFP